MVCMDQKSGPTWMPARFCKSFSCFCLARHDFFGVDPLHHLAQLTASLFDWQVVFALTQLVHGLLARLTFSQEVLGELAILDLLQSSLHALLHRWGDDAWAGVVITKLGSVRDRVAHVADATLNHQINDQLHFVQALEVSHFRGVASFNQGVEAVLDQLRQATAEHNLLTEQVGFGFFLEGGFDDASASTTETSTVRQGQLQGVTGVVLVNGNQLRNATASNELAAYGVTWTLRCQHRNVDVFWWVDETEVDVEAVGEQQQVAFAQIW